LKRVAVIGASGFVGSTLVERLRAGPDEVVPYIHSSGNAWRLARHAIDLRPLNLLEPAQVEAALTGVTHVVNCSRGGDEVMLSGLRNLLTASRKQRVERFIHLGSVAVYGDPPSPESVHESAPTLPAPGSYGSVKLQQDRMVAQAAAEGLSAVTLCPPNISGPYSSYLTGLVDALRQRAFALMDDGSAPCSLVDVANLCVAIELALVRGPRDGSRLFITDGEVADWRSVVEHLTPLAQSNGPVATITREALADMRDGPGKRPISLMKSFKHLVSSDVRQALRNDPLWERIDGIFRRGVARMGKSVEGALRLAIEGPLANGATASKPALNARLCRQQLRGVGHSCEAARAALGYQPLYTFDESMRAFAAWYRSHHAMDSDAWPLLRQLYSS
jgi:nucleoside-diphosphate-sugar epimerase